MRKSRSILTAVAALALTAAFAPRISAQPLGEGPLVLRLPASAHSLAIANVGIVSTDGDAMFYNPGMIANIRGSAISLQRYGSHGVAGSMATTSTAGTMTVGIGAQFVRYAAPMGATYADVMKPGATRLSDSGGVAASSTAITFGFAKTIKGFRLGASAKFAEDQLGARHDGVLAFDIGMNRALGPGTLGVVVQNLGAGPRIDGIKGTLPRKIGVGWAAQRAVSENFDFGGQAALTLEGDLFVRPAGGVELGYVPIEGVSFSARTGLRLPRERDESLVTAGLGMLIDRIAVDYALEPMRGGRPMSHRLGVRIR